MFVDYFFKTFQDDLRFFIYCDEGEMEYDADSAEEKNKVQFTFSLGYIC